jgi:hypothetical protein
MDDAEVRVTDDPCAGTETVELVNAAAGQQAVVDTESFAPDASCPRSSAEIEQEREKRS